MDLILRENAFLGETHVVTGAAQGIGFCVAEALARHGAQVAMVDLDAGRLEQARSRIEEAVVAPLVVAANVTEEKDVERAVAEILETSECINGVVNVAGITRDSRIVKKSLEDFNLVMAVHLGGTFLFTREVARQHWHPLFKANGNQPLDDGVNRELLLCFGPQRERWPGRLHGREGRDRIADTHDGARVLRLPSSSQRNRAGARQYSDARGRG
jgi:NAD(P)-dependent dehydrogenase (short-subunit alcohol dehydrogenase family)